MEKRFFYLLLLLVLCFLFFSCRSARQNNTSINISTPEAQNTNKEQKQPDQAELGKAAENEKAKNQEQTDEKNIQTNSRETDSAGKFENRCGWFSNPTPANAWLNDKDGEWIIGVQGGYQAEGDYPEFSDDQWVKTNVHHGYGCTCMMVKVDYKTRRVLQIASATAKPLSACRKDPALKEPRD